MKNDVREHSEARYSWKRKLSVSRKSKPPTISNLEMKICLNTLENFQQKKIQPCYMLKCSEVECYVNCIAKLSGKSAKSDADIV